MWPVEPGIPHNPLVSWSVFGSARIAWTANPGCLHFCLQLSDLFYLQQNLSSFTENCISCVKTKNMLVWSIRQASFCLACPSNYILCQELLDHSENCLNHHLNLSHHQVVTMTLNLKKGSKAYTPAFQAGLFTPKLMQGSAVLVVLSTCLGFPGGSEGKVSAGNAGDPGSIPR